MRARVHLATLRCPEVAVAEADSGALPARFAGSPAARSGSALNDLQTRIEAALRAAVVRALGDGYADADPLVTLATNPKFGDYASWRSFRA